MSLLSSHLETLDSYQTVKLHGDQTISGVKTFVDEVIFQSGVTFWGTTTTINTTNLQVEDNIIVLNYGEAGAGVTAVYAGIQIDRGSSAAAQMLWRESDDVFTVGIIGNLQAIATRQDSPNSGGLAYWNSVSNRFDTAGYLTYNTVTNELTVAGVANSVIIDGTNGVIEVCNTSGTPKIDFKNLAIDDADARIQLNSNGLAIYVGGNGSLIKSAEFTAAGALNLGTYGLVAHSVTSDASDGLIIEAANGTDVGILGVGNTANVTWYGNHNFQTITSGTWNGSVLGIAYGGTNATSQTANGLNYFDGTKITSSSNATLSFIAGDVDLLITHPSVTGTVYEIVVTSSSCQYVMAYNTASTFQGICGTGATENYWTLSTAGLGLYVSASSLWFGSTSNNDLSFYRNNTERLRLTTTGIYVPDVAYLSAASPTINTMVSGTSLIQSSVRLISAYSGAASANSSYFLGSGNDGGLLQVFGCSGTLASPTAITTDGRLGGFFGRGYAATGYSNAVTAIQYYAESTFTDTSTPTYITVSTTASGATTRREVARFDSRGALLFADGVADGIGFRGSLGSYSIQYYNDGSRYPLRFVGASDAGTNRWFEFGNYTSDTYGGTWNAKVSINSSTGYTTIGTVATGPWPVSTTYALFGNSSLDQTNAGNYSMVVSAGGELNFNRPTGQTIYMRENNGATSQLTVLTGGKVGVNINSPANYLDVWNNANSAVYNEVARFVVTNNSFSTNYSRMIFGQASTNLMFIEAANQSNTKGSLALQPYGGSVVVNGTTASRRLTVQGGSSSNDLMFYLKQSNDYGYSFNLDSFSTGRMWIKGVNNGIETDIMTLDRTNAYVGIGTTSPSWRLVVNENQGYSSRAANPVPAQIAVQSGNSGYLRLGNFYTGGVGTCSTIQSTDYFSGADHGCNLLLNPLGGNVGIGEDTPNFTLVARYTSTNPQISARYDGTSPSNYKELHLAYNGATGSGYGWIQALHNGTAYTPLCLNPYGGDVIIGGLSTPRAKLEVVGDIWTDWSNRFIGTVYQAGASYKMGIGTTTEVRALDLIAMSADSSAIRFWTGSTPSVNMYLDYLSNVVLGNQSALATNATDGFVYIRTCAGTPTGAPTAFTGHVAMLYDTTNNKLYAYNGAWKSVTLT